MKVFGKMLFFVSLLKHEAMLVPKVAQRPETNPRCVAWLGFCIKVLFSFFLPKATNEAGMQNANSFHYFPFSPSQLGWSRPRQVEKVDVSWSIRFSLLRRYPIKMPPGPLRVRRSLTETGQVRVASWMDSGLNGPLPHTHPSIICWFFIQKWTQVICL